MQLLPSRERRAERTRSLGDNSVFKSLLMGIRPVIPGVSYPRATKPSTPSQSVTSGVIPFELTRASDVNARAYQKRVLPLYLENFAHDADGSAQEMSYVRGCVFDEDLNLGHGSLDCGPNWTTMVTRPAAGLCVACRHEVRVQSIGAACSSWLAQFVRPPEQHQSRAARAARAHRPGGASDPTARGTDRKSVV